MSIETLALEIKDLSSKILLNEERILDHEKNIADYKKDFIELEKFFIEKEVLSNPEYKNENQRKIAIQEKLQDNEVIRENELKVWGLESLIQELELEIKKLKVEKTYKETLLKLAFIQLEKN